MRLLLKAGLAFVVAALLTGKLTLGPHWRAVAADLHTELHQASPQALVEAQVKAQALFQNRKY